VQPVVFTLALDKVAEVRLTAVRAVSFLFSWNIFKKMLDLQYY
jgi:hypothetical protein